VNQARERPERSILLTAGARSAAACGARTEGCFLLHHASAAVRRFDEREKPPNGGQTQQAEIQINGE